MKKLTLKVRQNTYHLWYIKVSTFVTRVASEAKRAKRAERNEVERVCGGEGGVPSASW